MPNYEKTLLVSLHIKTMETYCLSCKNTANKSFIVRITKENGLMLASNCAVCVKKKLRFTKSQKDNGL